MQEGTLGALGGPATTRANIEETHKQQQLQQQPTGTIRANSAASYNGTMISHAGYPGVGADFGGTMVVNEDSPRVLHAAHSGLGLPNPAGTMVVSSALGQASLHQADGTGDYLAALHAAASANDGCDISPPPPPPPSLPTHPTTHQADGTGDYLAALHAAASANDGCDTCRSLEACTMHVPCGQQNEHVRSEPR